MFSMVLDGPGIVFRRGWPASPDKRPVWDSPDGSVWFVRVGNVPRWSGSVGDVLGSALDGQVVWNGLI